MQICRNFTKSRFYWNERLQQSSFLSTLFSPILLLLVGKLYNKVHFFPRRRLNSWIGSIYMKISLICQ